MARWLVYLLTVTVLMSFVLAIVSIITQYTGALACWTACIAPLQVAISIVLAAVVGKNKHENSSAEGDGIRYIQLVNDMEGGEL